MLKLIALKQRSAVMKEKKAKYKVGDLVRIASKNVPFRKGFLQQFTNEIFSISTVFSTHPPSYILRDEKGQEIQGKFYEAEIIKVLKLKKIHFTNHFLALIDNEWFIPQTKPIKQLLPWSR